MNSSASKSKLEMCIADDLDYPTALNISNFLSTFSTDTDERIRRVTSAEYFLWKISENPAGKGFVTLSMDREKIVGTLTMTQKKLFFKGKLISAVEIGDVFTDPAYQRQGIFTSLVIATRDRAIDNGVQLIYGTPNEIALPGYEKKCNIIRKNGLDLFLWVLPLKPLSILLRNNKTLRQSFVCRMFDRTTILPIKGMASTFSRKSHENNLTFTEDFDELNNRLTHHYSMMLARRSEDLIFRLIKNPEKEKYKLIEERTTQGKIEAYLIYKECYQDNMKVIFIADLFGIDFRPMARLWNKMICIGVNQGVDLLAIWAPKTLASFCSFLPIPPIPYSKKEVILFNEHLGREALEDRGKWLFSIIDTDNI